MKTPHISIVSPVYGCSAAVSELCARLHQVLQPITSEYEVLLVEDASPDTSWEMIQEQCRKDDRVRGIRLSRNFGQHSAITAGLSRSRGEWVVVMDCDLQDQPEAITTLYEMAKNGYDMAFAQRHNRQDGVLKRTLSRVFFLLLSYLTETKLDPSVANFGIYHRRVIEAVLTMGDSIRFFPAMVQWVGFRKRYVQVEHGARFEGKTSYSFSKLCRLAMDTILTFSDKPLRLVVKFGMFICSATFLVGIYYLIRYIRGDIKVLGYASTILSIWLLGGVIIFILGIVGTYVGRAFDQVKQRPMFIIAEEEGGDED